MDSNDATNQRVNDIAIMIPSTLEHVHEIARSDDRLVVFLDYDDTLTPIVRNSSIAQMEPGCLQPVNDGINWSWLACGCIEAQRRSWFRYASFCAESC
jgi:hypothetical protein